MLQTMSKSSIKSVTLATSISGILLVSVVAVMIFDELVSRWLTEKYDQTLITKIELLQTLNAIDDNGFEFEFAYEFMIEYSREISPEYFQILIDRDQVFELSK